MRLYAIVQHSGYGYAGNPQFQRGLEQVGVGENEARQIVEAGGVVLPDYMSADDYCYDEMYPRGAEGIVPQARGAFLRKKSGGLHLYAPAVMPLNAVTFAKANA